MTSYVSSFAGVSSSKRMLMGERGASSRWELVPKSCSVDLRSPSDDLQHVETPSELIAAGTYRAAFLQASGKTLMPDCGLASVSKPSRGPGAGHGQTNRHPPGNHRSAAALPPAADQGRRSSKQWPPSSALHLQQGMH